VIGLLDVGRVLVV